MREDGRPNHIEDALCHMGSGQWFGWSDSKNKVYANLIIHPKIWNKDYTGKFKLKPQQIIQVIPMLPIHMVI